MSSAACAVLLSRKPELGKAELIELAELGTATFGVQCDSGDPELLTDVLHWVHEFLPSVATLAHAAGMLGYDTINDVSEEQFWHICNAKVRPCFHAVLHLICSKRHRKPALSLEAALPRWSDKIRADTLLSRCLGRMSCAAPACRLAAVTFSPAQPRSGASREHATMPPPTPTWTRLPRLAGRPLSPLCQCKRQRCPCTYLPL